MANFRMYFVDKNTGKNAGHIDFAEDESRVKDLCNTGDNIEKALGGKFVAIIARCPSLDSTDDKVDQIVEILKQIAKKEQK